MLSDVDKRRLELLRNNLARLIGEPIVPPGFIERMRDEIRAIAAKAKASTSGATGTRLLGNTTDVLISTDSQTVKLKGQYAVAELMTLQPSHLALEGFRVNPRYPIEIQERDYTQKNRQVFIIEKVDSFEPAYVLDATQVGQGGPPIIMPDGIALSGNGRTMMLTLVYRGRRPNSKAAAQAYRQALIERAPLFGFEPSEIEAMKEPVLVRVIVDEDYDRKQLTTLVSAFNLPQAQRLPPRDQACRMGRAFNEALLEKMGTLTTDESFLSWARNDPDFMTLVIDSGVIRDESLPAYLTDDNELTMEGAQLLRMAMVCRMLAEGGATHPAHMMTLMGKGLLKSLASAAPYIVSSAYTHPQFRAAWAPERAIVEALKIRFSFKASGFLVMKGFVSNRSLLHEQYELNQITVLLAEALVTKPGPNQQRKAWSRYENEASVGGQTLFGQSTPLTVLSQAFGIKPLDVPSVKKQDDMRF